MVVKRKTSTAPDSPAKRTRSDTTGQHVPPAPASVDSDLSDDSSMAAAESDGAPETSQRQASGTVDAATDILNKDGDGTAARVRFAEEATSIPNAPVAAPDVPKDSSENDDQDPDIQTTEATKGSTFGSGKLAVGNSKSEALAVRLLAELGIEPGALVGGDLPTLTAIIEARTAAKLDGEVALPQDDTPASLVVHQDDGSSAAPVVEHDSDSDIAFGSDHVAAQPTGTSNPADSVRDIAAALNRLKRINVQAHRVAGWSVGEMNRLCTLLSWSNPKNNMYSISNGPSDTDWGIPTAFDDMSNTLCVTGTSIPITYWCTGEIAAQWWVDGDGYPASRPAISIQPMATPTADACKDLLNDLCMPTGSSKVADQFGPSQMKSSRWMNTRASKGQPAKTHEFKALYDARKSLKDKTLLQQFSVRIGRYTVKEEGSSSNGKKRAMERWQAFFDLYAIYKIKDASVPGFELVSLFTYYSVAPYIWLNTILLRPAGETSLLTLMFEPSDSAMVDWMHDKRTLSLKQLQTLCRGFQPAWIVSIKRLRKLRNLHQPNIAVVPAQQKPLSDRESIAVAVDHLADVDSVTVIERFGELLGCDEPIEYGTLYERNPETNTWYYEVYGSGRVSDPVNAVMTRVMNKPVKGDVILVKNAPEGTLLDRVIDRQAIVRLLWYYAASGVDPAVIVSERNLQRILLS
ncbi:hypothetical protein C8R43DRAFT_948525 [Mycena crocata]|nr:hypothetical protein C8R43DRAFT_948525 [Mycena crocata]